MFVSQLETGEVVRNHPAMPETRRSTRRRKLSPNSSRKSRTKRRRLNQQHDSSRDEESVPELVHAHQWQNMFDMTIRSTTTHPHNSPNAKLNNEKIIEKMCAFIANNYPAPTSTTGNTRKSHGYRSNNHGPKLKKVSQFFGTKKLSDLKSDSNKMCAI